MLTVCWTVGMLLTLDEEDRSQCWDDYSDSYVIYIIVIPMILALSVNYQSTQFKLNNILSKGKFADIDKHNARCCDQASNSKLTLNTTASGIYLHYMFVIKNIFP